MNFIPKIIEIGNQPRGGNSCNGGWSNNNTCVNGASESNFCQAGSHSNNNCEHGAGWN